MKRLKFYIALWMAKLSIIALKVTGHRGTDFPGRIALKICPDFLGQTKGPDKILGVTGTNGKTTICNLLIGMLKADGKRIMDNRYGSNVISGLCTTFIRDMGLGGRCRSDVAVLEIDERSSRVVFPAMHPDVMLINNLTRDSIMRNGHPEYIARLLTKFVPAETKLIINGDDLIAASVAPSNERVYFGIEHLPGDVIDCINLVNDLQICPKCHGLLEFTARRYHHIGRAYCPECGFKSPELKYSADNADLENMTIEITCAGQTHTYRLVNESVFNIYNVVAAVAYMSELGYSPERIDELLAKAKLVETRFGEEEVNGIKVVRQMSKDKNALAASRVFDYVSGLPGDKELILMMNCLHDEIEWSENTCWLYDCDFEFLKKDNIRNIIVTGPRAKDYYLRLKFAGVDDDRITFVKNEIDAPSALQLNEGESIFIFYGTDSIDLANKVTQKVKDTIKAKTAGAGLAANAERRDA